MKIWQNLAFAAVCGTVLVVLLNAPPETTPKTPNDEIHVNPKEYASCLSCHRRGGGAPEVQADHLNKAGELVLDHQKCYMCHKPQE